ncbi:MAG: LysM peptidoglycan-binding domain-containing protein [Chlamydiia bacterium]|nr:LysM peptidoglycan-binding domain-containing protein [Chlamydiia bacterium]
MESFPLEKILARRTRLLIHSLIISGTLNIALLATFVTFVIKERKRGSIAHGVEAPLKRTYLKNKDLLKEFQTYSYDALVRELYDETPIEYGQRRCDLALATLSALYDFDVERAFGEFPIERRELKLGQESFILFAGVSNEVLEGVRLFARREVWPLTPRGLFQEIKKRTPIPPSLKETFCLTTPYFLIERAIRRLSYDIEKEDLFNLLIEASWKEVESLAAGIAEDLEGNLDQFALFLVTLVERGSSEAAYLLVSLEQDFALKRLTNEQMMTLISLLDKQSPEVESFLQEVQRGLRPTEVQNLAGKPFENSPRHYRVEYGDSLWKISRKFGVKVEIIQEMNGIGNESLQVGRELLLPPNAS